MHEKHVFIRVFLVATFLITVGGAIVLAWSIATERNASDKSLEMCCFIGPVLLLPLVGWAIMKAFYPPRYISYVGHDGLAMLALDRKRGRIANSQLLLFDTAGDLRVEEFNAYLAMFYCYSSYRYRWGRNSSFELKGVFRDKLARAPAHHPYYFAVAAEAAWTDFVLRRSEPEFRQSGFLSFVVDKCDRVSVGNGVIRLEIGNRSEQLRRDDIAGFSLHEGVFSIRSREAKWSGRAGKFDIRYSKIANARAFISALDTLFGAGIAAQFASGGYRERLDLHPV